jgi:hypothetical protein
MEKGAGNPSGMVPGFVSDLVARTPIGHCRAGEESGRLWFGLREEAVRARQDRIELGSLATRLFSLVRDAQVEGKEVEPSYSFGRIMWWWDRHYITMADYEPQYHRLDQLMRWGAAIAWLVNREGPRLPEVPLNSNDSGLRFFAWLAAHPELKWHWDNIPVVHPPGVNTEALFTVFSSSYEDCGTTQYWWGGISSPESTKISTLETSVPRLEEGIARAGARLAGTKFSTAQRAGTIASEKVSWKLGSVEEGAATVKVTASGRNVWSISGLKALVGETVPRHISLKLESVGKHFSQSIEVQGVKLGELSVSTEDTVASVTWKPNVLDRARLGLSRLQEKLLSQPLEEAAANAREASLVYNDQAAGRTFLRFDDTAGPRWMAIQNGANESPGEMAFRLGQPGKPGSEPNWYTARFTKPPVVKNEAGAPVKWLRFDTEPGGPPRIAGLSGPPGSDAEVLTVDFGGKGPKGKLYIDRVDAKRVQARSDDPFFGLRGTRDGSELLGSERWITARQAAKDSGDGYSRTVLLESDNVALVQADKITLIREGHPWHERVQQVLRQSSGTESDPLFKLDGTHAFLVDKPTVHLESSSETISSDDLFASLRDAANPQKPRGPPVFESGLAKELLVEGKIPPSPTGKPQQVRVVTARITNGRPGGGDLLTWDHAEWTQPADSSPPPELKPDRLVRLVYRSSDCDTEPQSWRCNNGH